MVPYLHRHDRDYTVRNLNAPHFEVIMTTARLPVNSFSLIYDSSLSWLPVKLQVRHFHKGMLDVKNLIQFSLTSYINDDVKHQIIPSCNKWASLTYKFSVFATLTGAFFCNPSSYLTIYNSNIIHFLCCKSCFFCNNILSLPQQQECNHIKCANVCIPHMDKPS